MGHVSFDVLMLSWLNRYKKYKEDSKTFHTKGCAIESGIIFGRQAEVGKCLEELVLFMDVLQKQSHVVYEDLLSLREKYHLGDLTYGGVSALTTPLEVHHGTNNRNSSL